MKTSSPNDAVAQLISAANAGDLETVLSLYEPGASYVAADRQTRAGPGSSTGIGKGIARKLAEEGAPFLPNSPGRLGRPIDVANVVALLASPVANDMNGANYRVDGGSATAIN